MAYGYFLEAEYSDGFTLTEDEGDQSPYDPDRNIFHAIVNNYPVVVHGKLKRFSIISLNRETYYNVDFSILDPFTNPRPFYERHMQSTISCIGEEVSVESVCIKHIFGCEQIINGEIILTTEEIWM